MEEPWIFVESPDQKTREVTLNPVIVDNPDLLAMFFESDVVHDTVIWPKSAGLWKAIKDKLVKNVWRWSLGISGFAEISELPRCWRRRKNSR